MEACCATGSLPVGWMGKKSGQTRGLIMPAISPMIPPPEWTRQAVIYQIFVDRFNPGNGRALAQPGNPGRFLRRADQGHHRETGLYC